MADVTETHEIIQFWCHQCDHRWQQEYDRRSGGWSGFELAQYFGRGVPVSPPYDGVVCPQCGNPQGKVASVVAQRSGPSRALPPQRAQG